MDRVTQRLWRGVEGPRRRFIYPLLLGAFRPPKPDNRICCDTHSMVTGTLGIVRAMRLIQVACNANVKRACMAAVNVDVGADQPRGNHSGPGG